MGKGVGGEWVADWVAESLVTYTLFTYHMFFSEPSAFLCVLLTEQLGRQSSTEQRN